MYLLSLSVSKFQNFSFDTEILLSAEHPKGKSLYDYANLISKNSNYLKNVLDIFAR